MWPFSFKREEADTSEGGSHLVRIVSMPLANVINLKTPYCFERDLNVSCIVHILIMSIFLWCQNAFDSSRF